MNKVDLALAYAARGWKVLALQPNSKIPLKSALQEHGSKDATDNPNTIRILWGEYPNANVGIATGESSGLTVLDLPIVDEDRHLSATQQSAGREISALLDALNVTPQDAGVLARGQI